MHITAELCAIHQPNFFPRLSTLAKLYCADRWIILDNVQFVRHDYQHRCRLTCPNGTQWQWLPLSVHLPRGRASRIDEVSIVDGRKCQLRTAGMIRQYYGRSPHWKSVAGIVDAVTGMIGHTSSLAGVSAASTHMLLDLLAWPGQIQRATDLQARTGRSERLADLTYATDSRRYLCGSGGRRYLDETPFQTLGVQVDYFDPPGADDSPLWTDSRVSTALYALAVNGVEQVRDALQKLADQIRSTNRI